MLHISILIRVHSFVNDWDLRSGGKQGPGGAASAALASPPLFVGDVAGGSGGAHGGLGGLGTGHMSHDNLLGLGGHFPGTSPLQFPRCPSHLPTMPVASTVVPDSCS